MKLYIPMVALAAALASMAVQAQDRPLTREEVKADLARARADGSLETLRSDYYVWWQGKQNPSTLAGAAGRSAEKGAPAMQTGKTRAEVKEEALRARDNGDRDSLERNRGYGH